MRKVLFALVISMALSVCLYGQTRIVESGTATLQSRKVDRTTGQDNYVNAAYSFEKATNGTLGLSLTRNDWDILFSSYPDADGRVVRDVFGVTMVVDDRSRLRDLGKVDWNDSITLPVLPAFDKPENEKPADAIVGHMYLVHTVDGDSDFYTLFRLDEMKSGESAKISWKRIPPPIQ